MKKLLIAWAMLLVCLATRAQTINKLEYFIDTDKGVGKNKLVNVTATADGSFPFTVALSGLPAGYHMLYIRTKDSKGKWSITARQPIQVLPVSGKEIIASGEYFFDTDEGFGLGKKIAVAPQDSIILQDFTAAVNTLQPGYHKMYVRLLDNYGNWSQTARYNVQVVRGTGTQYIVEAEYFFTKDAGVGHCASVALTPAANGTFSFNIPADQVPSNAKNLYVRIRDSSNNDWSATRSKKLPADTTTSGVAMAIAQVSNPSVALSPNPAHNYFNISFKGLESKRDIQIFVKDISGRILISKKLSAASTQQIDVATLAKSTYFVTVIAQDFMSTQKLIVQ